MTIGSGYAARLSTGVGQQHGAKHGRAQERLTLGQDDGVAEVAAQHLDVVPVGRVEGGVRGGVGARQRHHRVAVIERPGRVQNRAGLGHAGF